MGSECASVLPCLSYVLRRCAVLSRQVDVIDVPSNRFAVLCGIHSAASAMSSLCVLLYVILFFTQLQAAQFEVPKFFELTCLETFRQSQMQRPEVRSGC